MKKYYHNGSSMCIPGTKRLKDRWYIQKGIIIMFLMMDDKNWERKIEFLRVRDRMKEGERVAPAPPAPPCWKQLATLPLAGRSILLKQHHEQPHNHLRHSVDSLPCFRVHPSAHITLRPPRLDLRPACELWVCDGALAPPSRHKAVQGSHSEGKHWPGGAC